MGIDVYHGTGPVNWQSVRDAGHSFGIVKATEGVSLIDANLSRNLAGLADAGMVRGVYHFFHVAMDPERQAAHFLNMIHDAGYNHASEMPCVLDLEDRAGTTQVGLATMRAHVQAFNAAIQAATGKRPIIYLDYDFGQNLLGEGYGGHLLWLAHYVQRNGEEVRGLSSLPADEDAPPIPSGWSRYLFWQFTQYGTVPGIEGIGNVDIDHFNGTEDQLRSWIATGVLG